MTVRQTKYHDIAIIGGGASGLIAALYADRDGRDVCIIESGERVGKKILSTGNGKCNLSHSNITAEAYHGSGKKNIEYYLKQYDVNDTLDFFKSIGLVTRERDGYIYPYSEQASAVLDVLRFSLQQTDIKIYNNCMVDSFDHTNNMSLFEIHTSCGNIMTKRIILCTGGYAAPNTGSNGKMISYMKSCGEKVVDPTPALVKLKSDSDICNSLNGVRAKGSILVYCNDQQTSIREYGEIQFTKDGLSGIPIFNISSQIGYFIKEKKNVSVELNMIPDLDEKELVETMENRILTSRECLTSDDIFTGVVNKKISQSVMKLCGIKASMPAKELSKKQIINFFKTLKSFRFHITDTYGYDSAQVTAGGISFEAVDKNLQSKGLPGVYYAGEILDIDGICGGYNLQWAWTSGAIAGQNAAKSIG